jgi:uncharacterized membrane protein
MVRRQNERETRKENRAIWFFIVLVALLLILASYGYFSGRWDEWSSGYEVGKPK